MASTDIELLFTNLLLDETFELSCDKLLSDNNLVSELSRREFKKLMETQENILTFDEKFISKQMELR